MWTTEHIAETDLPRDAVWTAIREVHAGRRTAPGLDVFELTGPFAVGSVVHVTPEGQDTIASTIVELEDGVRYADRTELDGIALVFSYDLRDTADGGTSVTHRLVIEGEAADAVAPELGPQIAADFPASMAATFEVARAIREPAA
jgi:hypothetical protein